MICGCCPAMIQLFIPVLLLLFKPIYQRLPQKQRELIDTGIKKCQQMIRNIWKKFGSPDNKKTEWCASCCQTCGSCCQTNDNKKTEDCGSCCQTNDNKNTEDCGSCCQTNDNKKTKGCGSCCETKETNEQKN
eukprot:506392_1